MRHRLRASLCWSPLRIVESRRMLVGGILIATLAAWSGRSLADEFTHLLIVTGEDPVHDWQATTSALRQLLSKDQRLAVDVHADLTTLADVELSRYRAVLLNFKNTRPDVPGPQALERLRDYVRGGGGLVLVHFACGAFEQQKPLYAELVGRVWFGLDPPPGRRQHDPRGPFQVFVRRDHVVTQGLLDFAADDELYTCLEGDVPIEIVATAVSRIDNVRYPMAMLHCFGEGRVFNCTLGHDDRALRVPGVAELYRRGSAWAAGLPPTQDDSNGDVNPREGVVDSPSRSLSP